MSREDQYAVSVSVDGEPLGVFDKFSGGETSSEETKYKPGGMVPQRSLGGSASTDNVTVSRLYDLERGDNDLVKRLRPRTGRGIVVVSKQPLDVDGNPFGKPDVYTGKLQRIKAPDHDSESTSAGIWEMEVSTEGTVG